MLRVFEAFSGIGTQRMALRNLGIEHEVVCIAEIDKFAIRSYEAIHGETLNLGDVSKIDPNDVPDHDLFTYSFPCQDISVAGKGKGFKPESGTRSSLLWECEKIIEAKRPKYLLMENVKALIFKKFKPGFEKWLRLLEELGYTNYWQVLNAKDYGIPQNRERVFCVSILGTHEPYVFPKPIPLEKRLKNVLEDEVDERFYINSEKANELLVKLNHQLPNQETSYCIDANYHKGTTIEQFVNKNRRQLVQENLPNTVGGGGLEPKIVCEQRTDEGLRFFKDGCVGTLRTIDACGDKRVLVKQATKKGYIECNVPGVADLSFPDSKTRRGRVQEKGEIVPTITAGQQDKGVVELEKQIRGCLAKTRPNTDIDITFKDNGDIRPHRTDVKKSGISELQVICDENISNTVTASHMPKTYSRENYRIRKLTPKECWRLMGISDEDFEKAQKVNSDTQLYKQAGNAIVVDVLEGIFRKLFLSKFKEKGNKLEEQLEWLDDLLGVGT